MFVLFMIVVFAVFALWLSNTERKHPAALILLGLMCFVLGGRAVALFSDSYSDEYAATLYAAEDTPPTAPSTREDEVVLGEVSSDAEMSDTATVTTSDHATPVSSSTVPRELAVEPKPTFRYLNLPRPGFLNQSSNLPQV